MTETQTKPWVLVTGGSRGIGRGIVEALAARGYEVVFTYLNSDTAAAEVEAAVAAAGGKALGMRCDGTDEEQVQTMVRQLLAARGAPYGLILNAGITRDALILQMSVADWDRVIESNLRGVFLTMHAFLPAMIENRDGVVLQMSSVTGLKGNPGQSNYAATKAAMMGMTRTLALELGRFNIRVNAIAPGFIETEMLSDFPETRLSQIRKAVPLRRLGRIADVSGLVDFLLSPHGSYITGQTLVVDGGLSA